MAVHVLNCAKHVLVCHTRKYESSHVRLFLKGLLQFLIATNQLLELARASQGPSTPGLQSPKVTSSTPQTPWTTMRMVLWTPALWPPVL